MASTQGLDSLFLRISGIKEGFNIGPKLAGNDSIYCVLNYHSFCKLFSIKIILARFNLG